MADIAHFTGPKPNQPGGRPGRDTSRLTCATLAASRCRTPRVLFPSEWLMNAVGDGNPRHFHCRAGQRGKRSQPGLERGTRTGRMQVFDLDLIPRRELRSNYYPDIEELFDVLDETVKVAKRDYGVRVFNLSFSLG